MHLSDVVMLQAKSLLDSAKENSKQSPSALGQAEEGRLDKPKHSGEDFGVMSARAGSWTDLPHAERCLPSLPLA